MPGVLNTTSVTRYIKENTQRGVYETLLWLAGVGFLGAVVYGLGLLDAHAAIVSSAITLASRLVADRLRMEIFARFVWHCDMARLRKAHHRIAGAMAILAIPLLVIGAVWPGGAQSGLEKTLSDLVVWLGGVLLVGAIQIRKPDPVFMRRAALLIKDLADTLP